MSSEGLDVVYLLLNASVMPWWAVFLAAPRSGLSARLASHAGIFIALGVLYALLFGAALAGPSAESAASLSSMQAMQAVLASPLGFLAGWTHYLAFDLFVGSWIIRESQRIGVAPRVELFFTLMAGPIGLLLFLVRRYLRIRTLGESGAADAA